MLTLTNACCRKEEFLSLYKTLGADAAMAQIKSNKAAREPVIKSDPLVVVSALRFSAESDSYGYEWSTPVNER